MHGRRAISQLLALLVIIAITLGIILVASGIVSNILVRQAPKGSVLMLTGFTWYKSYDAIVVHGYVTNVGVNSVNVTAIYVRVNGRKYKLNMHEIIDLKPNEYSEVVGWRVIRDFPKLSELLVEEHWCNRIECAVSYAHAKLPTSGYALPIETITVPIRQTVTMTVTRTETTTYTTTIPTPRTTTTTTSTTTTTTTTTITKPSWVVSFEACYDVNNNINVYGVLQKPISVKGPIPYIVKYLRCNVFGCDVLAVKVFE